ncbi:MAG: hypothetical protein ABSG72_11725 [Candidatus Sulfotelmatobacter sp.]
MRRADDTSVQSYSWWTCIRAAIRHRTLPLVFVLSVVLAAGSASLAQASGQNPLPDEQPATVRGTVVNAITNAPISRALVYSPDNRFAMLTDSEGHFEFTLPKASGDHEGSVFMNPPGHMWNVVGLEQPFWLIARKPGFLDNPNDRRLAEAIPANEITIPLMPEGLIKGRVIISEADPATGITVQLLARQVQDGMPKWAQTGSARANSDGEFRFAELQPGTYKLGTSELMDNDPVAMVPGGQPYGFPPVYYPGVSDFATAGTILLTAGQTVQADLPLTRQPYYPVRIPVANPDLNASMNIAVSVLGHRGPGYRLGYNSEKQTIEGSLPNGNYLVEATTYGQISATGAVNLAVVGASAEGPSMTLTRAGSISVHVTEQFTSSEERGITTWNTGGRSFEVHGPRQYLQVNAESSDDFEQRPGASLRPPTGPDDDSLVLENLVPGRYRMRFYSSRGYVAAATMGGVDLLHETLAVAPASTTPIEVIVRDDYAEIDGTVTGLTQQSALAPGSPGPGFSPPVWVYCVPSPDSPGHLQQLAVSPDGKFNSTTMVPGSYRVLAFSRQQSNLPYRDAEAMKAYDSMGPVVHLTSGQKANIQVPISSSE